VRLLADQSADLLITDVMMPGISGFEFARQAELMRPNLRIMYVSGYNADADRGTGPIYGVVLQKPIRPSDLLQEVDRQLSSGPHGTG
jgi:CheY-like chemotaxis protein